MRNIIAVKFFSWRTKFDYCVWFDSAFSALDDMLLAPGRCHSGGTTETPPTGTPPPEQQLTCTFEDDSLCGWAQDQGDARDWVLTTGKGVDSTYGPLVDHTTHLSDGKSFVMYCHDLNSLCEPSSCIRKLFTKIEIWTWTCLCITAAEYITTSLKWVVM